MPTVSGPDSRWINRYAALGDAAYSSPPAQAIPSPHWVATSDAAAQLLGWPADWHERADWRALEVFSGAAQWEGMQPLATVYSGHQFGVWAGQLGDGRALMLGEVDTPAGGIEVQLKGSGLTPYSRMGDGRAVLRSSIREYLCSEAMHHLGVPTTRALCVIGSPLPVRRETVESAAVVTRLSPSFVRFGHFEHFAHHGQPQMLTRLADYVIERYYPECAQAACPAVALLEAVTRRTAALIAHWQALGFCHGVMNTDNMSILGLTIDYGPFGFLDGFDPGHICNHSDHGGRYAYARQPQVALWNLHALAQALLPLALPHFDSEDAAIEALLQSLETYRGDFTEGLLARMRAKLGLVDPHEGDRALIDDLLGLMAAGRSDFTRTFRALADFRAEAGIADAALRDTILDREAFDAWTQRYAQRLRAQGLADAPRALQMKRANPKFVLRNHLAQAAIERAQEGDFSEVRRLLKVLEHPYDEQAEWSAYADLPPDWASSIEVSCSS
ncbi:MAG TPA: YdiU family protein [Burkholderiaceae bacterium]|nr:YdiU family protein [Burkholderiaceae bacterium]